MYKWGLGTEEYGEILRPIYAVDHCVYILSVL